MQIEVRPRKIKTGRSNPETLRSEKSNSRFSHDDTKIPTKNLSLFLSFYFHVILEHLKTFIQTNFRFKRVLCFAIQDA